MSFLLIFVWASNVWLSLLGTYTFIEFYGSFSKPFPRVQHHQVYCPAVYASNRWYCPWTVYQRVSFSTKRGQSDACCSLPVTLWIVDFVSALPSASVCFTWPCNTAYPPPHPVQPRSFSFPGVRDVLHCALPFHHVDANEQARLWGTPLTVITSSDCIFWIRHSFMVLEILVHQVPIFSVSLDFIPCVKTQGRLYVLLIQKVIVDTLRS